MTIILQFFPNGEFSQGVDTSNRRLKHVCKKAQTSAFDLAPTHISNREYTDYDLLVCKQQTADMGAEIYGETGTHFAGTGGQTFKLVESGDYHCVLTRLSDNTEGGQIRLDTSIYRAVHVGLLSPLVHQSVESCDKPKSRKKLEGMTKRMGRNIRNAVYLLEQEPGGKDVLSFLTLTLPNLSSENLAKCCEHWDSMVKQFMDWLRVTLQRKGIEFSYVYCTEIQTKRLEIRHEYAPHLHLVFKGRNGKKKPWAIAPKQARQAWKRCITSVVDVCFNESALENLQRIRYSAARYLSKYLSKGRCCVPRDTEGDAIASLRTQWGGMCRVLSRRIRQFTTRLGGTLESSRMVVGILANMQELLRLGFISYYKAGFIALGIDKTTGLEYGLHVGCGCLRVPSYQGGLIPILETVIRLLD